MTERTLRVVVVVAAFAAITSVATADVGLRVGEVYRVWLDGRTINLSGNVAYDTDPVASPDGRWVIFARHERRVELVRLYVVRSDGRQLHAISSVLSTRYGLEAKIAWSPDSRRVVVVASRRDESALILLDLSGRQRRIARAPSISNPGWSPSGRIVAFGVAGGTEVWAVTPTGKRAWRILGSPQPPFQSTLPWSARGLLAVADGLPRTIRVYDERGRLHLSFAGRPAAWSPDGRMIASIVANRVEVRALSGRVLLRKAVPGLPPKSRTLLTWTGDNDVLVSGRGVIAVANVVRRTVLGGSGNRALFGNVSPDQRLAAGVTSLAQRVALQVARVDGTGRRILLRGPRCVSGRPEHFSSTVAWLPDGRSLLYEVLC